jgi:HSP20 family molecular chaperone IbpA
MLSTKTTSTLPQVVKARLQSPAVYPILGHLARDVSRRFSLMSTSVSQSYKPSANEHALLKPFFHDVDEPFPFSSTINKNFRSLLDEIKWIDKERMKEYFPEYKFDRTDDRISLTLKLPEGMKKEDIKVEVKDNKQLHIFGERKETKDDGWVSQIKFDRSLSFGDNIDSSMIAASLADGILKVQLPLVHKLEPVSRNIAIE